MRWVAAVLVPVFAIAAAWESHGLSNASLVDALVRNGLIHSDVVEKAMRLVDRGWFLPKRSPATQYHDSPQILLRGATISAPHMHAIMLEHMAATPCGLEGEGTILDIGSGSGYLTAALSAIAGPNTRVVGIEHIPELVEYSKEVVNHSPLRSWLESGRISFVCDDARRESIQRFGPFRAVHVGAAAATIPQYMRDSLLPGGRIVVPVGEAGESQELQVIDRSLDGASFSVKHAGGVVFVPLTDLSHYPKGF